MKVYNYSTAVVSVDGVVPTGQVFEIPENFEGDLLIGSTLFDFQDEVYSYISISDSGGTHVVNSPKIPQPPVWESVLLLVMLGFFALMVKLTQKVKAG